MEIAMAALGPLLPKLANLLAGEFTLEKHVRKGVESLAAELALMHAALRKVAKVPLEQLDEGAKIWAGMVRELSYQMEDIVDAFMVHVENGGEPANPKNRVKKLLKKTKRLFKKGKGLHRISDALEEVLAQAEQLAKLRQRYEQETRDTDAGASIDPRLMGLYRDVTELVGLEGPRDKLINMLTEGDDWLKRPLKTVSIVGFGGLGKTTLARAIYETIKGQFQCAAFVSVSQNPDMKKVFKDVLYELDKDKYAGVHDATRDERQLIDMLHDFLQNKRYLIIIDDIWNGQVWELIKCAFPKKSPGSRLITTTRIASVSEACCSCSDDIYIMEPLSDDLSRTLFYKRIFSDEKRCPQELMQVSIDILKKCGGIPLAIITIASLLASKHQMKTKDQWYALLSSIGHGLTEDHSLEQMKKILLFSYYDLPSHLKPCLLYLSIFPEDHKIMRKRLIWRWISEGFVYSEKLETSLYELGDSYFNELVNRSMIQPIGTDDEEKVEACRVHDMVLDLICSLSSEENFVTILNGTRRKMPNSESKVRRLSIQNSKIDVDTTRMEHMRSLTIFTTDAVGKVLDISSFQVLRVLDLEGCDVSDIEYVGNLLHLRYLGINHTNVVNLPMEIGSLQFLQTLNIMDTEIDELPPSVVRLRRLIHLCFGPCVKLPSGIGSLTSLEVVDRLWVRQSSSGNSNLHVMQELGHLTKLRKLSLDWNNQNKSPHKSLVESLNNLQKLEILDIMGHSGSIDLEGWVPPLQLRKLRIYAEYCSLGTLRSWIRPSSLPLLSYLCIRVPEMRSRDIKLLGMLLSLCCVTIDHYNSDRREVVKMSVITSDAFPCARECHLFNITAVPSIFPSGAAPKLKHLRFSFPAMWIARGDFNLGMGHLPSLEKVDVTVWSENSTDAEVNEAEAAVRAAVEDHPNRPLLELWCRRSAD